MRTTINASQNKTYTILSKSLFITAVFAMAMISYAFAGNDGSPRFKGVDNFAKTFPTATSVTYVTKGQLTEVNFTWNNLKLQAFYDQEGNWVGTSRNVPMSSLPVNAIINIKDKFPGFVPTEAIEFDQAEAGVSYYVTIAGPGKAYIVNVLTDGTISVFKKMKN